MSMSMSVLRGMALSGEEEDTMEKERSKGKMKEKGDGRSTN